MDFSNITDNLPALIIGAIFAVIGVVLLVKQFVQKKNNTESVIGEVSGYESELRFDSDSESVVYYAVVKYCVSGHWYEQIQDVGRSRKKYQVGEKLELFYNPDNPEQFSIAGDKVGIILAVVCLAIGIAAVVFALFPDILPSFISNSTGDGSSAQF